MGLGGILISLGIWGRGSPFHVGSLIALTPVFKKISHEKQFDFNEQVRDKVESAVAALELPSQAVEKARTLLKEGEKVIDARQKNIKIADRSEHGWATVQEYEEDELADNSDDEKRLFRTETRAGRKLKQKNFKNAKKSRPVARIFRRGVTWMSNLHKHTRLGGLGACSPWKFLEIRCSEIVSEAILRQKHSYNIAEYCIRFSAVRMYAFTKPSKGAQVIFQRRHANWFH